MNNDNAPAYNPNYVEGDFYRQQHVEEYDIESSELLNRQQKKTTNKTATARAGQVGGVAAAAKTVRIKAKELDEKHKILHNAKKMAANAAQTAKTVDEKHRVTEKTKKAAGAAMAKVKDVNEKHQVTEKTKNAAGNAASKARDVDEQHHVAEKTKSMALAATKKVALGVKFISRSMASKRTPASGSAVPVSVS